MEKGHNYYSVKGVDLTIKDMDESQRKVAIYLSKFDVIDSDMDMLKKGCFKKSIMERGPKSSSNRQIAFLRYHNWEMPIGKFDTLEEDSVGLFAVAQLGNSTLGKDAWEDYKDGIIREHSIGFKYIADKIRMVEDPTGKLEYFEINEVALWEGSAVTFGANEYTEVVDVMKSENRISLATRIYNELETITKSLKNGQGTDERLYNLEMRLKYLNSRLFELATIESHNDVKHSIQVNEPRQVENSFDWNKVFNKF